MARTLTLDDMSTALADEHQDVTRTSATGGHRFTLNGAADATGTSKRTLLRRIDELTRHGAEKDDTGAWSIPLAALLAAGFKVGAPRTSDTDQPAPERAPGSTTDLDELRTELESVRAELVDTRHRAALLEAERSAAVAIATERAAHVDSLRAALRALEAPAKTQQPTTLAELPYRPKLWRRILLGL